MSDTAPTDKKWDLDRIVRNVLFWALILALFGLVRYLSDVLVPFAAAVLIAYLLNPVVTLLERKMGRTPAVLLTVFVCMALLVVFVGLLVDVGGRELGAARDLIAQFGPGKAAIKEMQDTPIKFQALIESQENATIKAGLQAMYDWLSGLEIEDLNIPTLATAVIKKVAPGLMGIVSGALSFVMGLTGLVIVVLYVVFLLIDYRRLSSTWSDYLPPKYRSDIIGFLDEFKLAMGRYFRGQFIIAACTGVVLAIGFGLIGLRMAILLGLGIGMLNMVPYLQTVGLIPALLLGLVRAVEGGGSVWASLVMVLAVFAVAQTIQDAILTPRIMGQTTGLRPVMLLLGVFIWGKLLGFLGLVLAIPLTCLGLAYYRRFVLGDRNAKVISDEDDPVSA